MNILAVESSCDETAVAIVKDGREVLCDCIASQVDLHRIYGGVVPEIASRKHIEAIYGLADQALEKTGLKRGDIDAVAVTYAPGLIGALLVGVNYAKGLSYAKNKPLIPVHHLRSHIAANYITHPDLKPPFFCLVVSGGNTMMVEVKDYTDFNVIGRTRDDAAGEAFDKCGKLLGLGYPAGATIGKLAVGKNRKFHHFPRALKGKADAEFSFSGLKTAVLRYVESHSTEYIQENLGDICASLEESIVDILVSKTVWALKKTGMKTLVVGGGVSANMRLRELLEKYCLPRGIRLCFPERSLSTDNGAMIAGVAYHFLMRGDRSDWNTVTCARIPQFKRGLQRGKK